MPVFPLRPARRRARRASAGHDLRRRPVRPWAVPQMREPGRDGAAKPGDLAGEAAAPAAFRPLATPARAHPRPQPGGLPPAACWDTRWPPAEAGTAKMPSLSGSCASTRGGGYGAAAQPAITGPCLHSVTPPRASWSTLATLMNSLAASPARRNGVARNLRAAEAGEPISGPPRFAAAVRLFGQPGAPS